MTEFLGALVQDLSNPRARNPIGFLASTTRETAVARRERGEWPGDVADKVIAAATRVEDVISAAYQRHWTATDTMRTPAVVEDDVANAQEARRGLAPLGAIASKLVSEANTLVAACRPRRQRFYILGSLAAQPPGPELDVREREIRGVDAGRKIEDVRLAIINDARRKDDERFLAHNIDRINDARDHVLDDTTRGVLDGIFVKREGKAERVAALRSAAALVSGMQREADGLISAFASLVT